MIFKNLADVSEGNWQGLGTDSKPGVRDGHLHTRGWEAGRKEAEANYP